MYGCIDRGYGILISDSSGVHFDLKDNLAFIKEYIAIFEDFEEEDDDDSEYLTRAELADFDGNACLEYMQACELCWTAYSGDGDAPCAIGISTGGWAYWELSGPNGILASAKIEGPTDEELKLWNKDISDEIKECLKKYGLEPRVFWTTSTS